MRTNRIFVGVLLAGALFLSAVAAYANPQETVDQATTIIQRFQSMEEQGIPRYVMDQAKGLAVLTVFKAGFIFSGRGGSGLVVAKTPKGWSGPSFIGTGGVGFGPQIGGEVTEVVMVLNTDEAVRALSRGGNVQLGGDVSIAAGPIGRSAEVGVTPVAAVYSYSRTQGLFAGASLEGTVVGTRDEANTQYYGHPVSPQAILAGQISPPRGARTLISALSSYCNSYASLDNCKGRTRSRR